MIELTFLKELILTLFRMGFSRTAHGYVVPKSLPPHPKICHKFYNDETRHSYSLPKEDPKTT